MAGIGVYDLDLGSDTGIWSPTTFELLGIPVPADRIGRSGYWRDLVHPDDRDHVARDYDAGRLNGGEWRTQFRFHRADNGELRWLSVAGQFLHENGVAVRSSGIVIDITDQKCAEAEAARARLRLDRISRATPSLIHIYDREEHRTVWANGRVREMVGADAEEVVGHGPLFDPAYIPPEDFAHLALRHAALDGAPDGQVVESEFRYRQPGRGDRWLLDRTVVFERSSAGHIKQTLSATIDITERKRSEERQSLLLNELNHRVKNTLAIIQSIAHQTFSDKERRHVFEERLSALSSIHDLLTNERWEAADVCSLIAQATAPYAGPGDRFLVSGPALLVPPRVAVALSLALHELCTNATKYGALSVPDGRVGIEWRLSEGAAGRHLILDWREHGGPAVQAPGTRGFGSRLIERGLAADLEGSALLDFRAEGVHCRIEAKLPAA